VRVEARDHAALPLAGQRFAAADAEIERTIFQRPGIRGSREPRLLALLRRKGGIDEGRGCLEFALDREAAVLGFSL
jgi:hypothetical protein